MGWLRFGLPLEEELAVETHAREIREITDIHQLQAFTEQLYRAWANQVDISAQLIGQLAEAEALLAQQGVIEPIDEKYLQWARELNPGCP